MNHPRQVIHVSGVVAKWAVFGLAQNEWIINNHKKNSYCSMING
jgi:hypothetical protein